MRRVLVLAAAIVAGFTLSACGGLAAVQKAVPVMPQPLIANTPPVPTAVAARWAPVQTTQADAARLEVAEVQYATCYAYAGLDQGLIPNIASTTAPVDQTCSTYGLSSAEVREIQDLLTETA